MMTTQEQILQLLYRAMWAIDTRNVEQYANCFADEAVFTDIGINGTASELIGKEAIHTDAITRLATPSMKQHRIANPLFVEHDAENVTVYSYWSTSNLDQSDGSFSIGSSGILTDDVVLRNGEWLIARHRVELWRPGTPLPGVEGQAQ